MALYQATTQQQLMQQLQRQQNALYMSNQGNVNWNLIQYQQLLYAQQLYNNANNFQTPFIVTMPTIQSIPVNTTNTNTNKSTGLSLNASIFGSENANIKPEEALDSPVNIDSMSPSTISSLLNAPEFIPTPKSENNDENEGKDNQKLNAHCNEFLPGVTSWKSNTLAVIKEDEDDEMRKKFINI
eukprot:203031_1